jgi:hypothetical protein
MRRGIYRGCSESERASNKRKMIDELAEDGDDDDDDQESVDLSPQQITVRHAAKVHCLYSKDVENSVLNHIIQS